MNTSVQAQSKPTTNLKLSAAQIAMLRNELAPAGSEGRSFVSNISTGNALITKGMAERVKGRYSANTIVITAAGCEAIGLDYNDVISAQLKKAAKREMIAYVAEESVVATEAELIEWTGWDADPQYLIDAYVATGGEMIVEETAIATEEAASEDELPAKMPLPAIVDADTAPVMDAPTVTPAVSTNPFNEGDRVTGPMSEHFGKATVTRILGNWVFITYDDGSKTSMGWAYIKPAIDSGSDETPAAPVEPAYAANDHVTFNYFRDPNYKDEVYQGRIMECAFDRLSGWMYRIDPAPCAFHLSPRWISERYVRTTLTGEAVASMVANDHVSALYDAMTMAEKVYMDYARLDTFDMPADHATFKRKVSAHIAFLRAKQAYTGVRSDAMITYLYGVQNAPQTPHNGTPAAVDDVQAFSANLDQRKPEIASEPFAPINATNDHPLALIQPGSVASKTDWDALKVKRAMQYATAKARVDENMKRVMGGGL
jgi:hypothetical protein